MRKYQRHRCGARRRGPRADAEHVDVRARDADQQLRQAVQRRFGIPPLVLTRPGRDERRQVTRIGAGQPSRRRAARWPGPVKPDTQVIKDRARNRDLERAHLTHRSPRPWSPESAGPGYRQRRQVPHVDRPRCRPGRCGREPRAARPYSCTRPLRPGLAPGGDQHRQEDPQLPELDVVQRPGNYATAPLSTFHDF